MRLRAENDQLRHQNRILLSGLAAIADDLQDPLAATILRTHIPGDRT